MKTKPESKTLQAYQSMGRRLSLKESLSHDDHYFCTNMGHARKVTRLEKIRLESLAAKHLEV